MASCDTSREIGGFHTRVPGESDLLGSDPCVVRFLDDEYITMLRTVGKHSPNDKQSLREILKLSWYFTFGVIGVRCQEDRHDVSEREFVSFFRIITSWARCVTLYTPSGLAYF